MSMRITHQTEEVAEESPTLFEKLMKFLELLFVCHYQWVETDVKLKRPKYKHLPGVGKVLTTRKWKKHFHPGFAENCTDKCVRRKRVQFCFNTISLQGRVMLATLMAIKIALLVIYR